MLNHIPYYNLMDADQLLYNILSFSERFFFSDLIYFISNISCLIPFEINSCYSTCSFQERKERVDFQNLICQ